MTPLHKSTNYYRTADGWGFEVFNSAVRTWSEGYATKKAAMIAARDIKDGIRNRGEGDYNGLHKIRTGIESENRTYYSKLIKW